MSDVLPVGCRPQITEGKNDNNINKGQSHLAQGRIAVNMLFGGRGSCMGSAMVPLDRALLSSYRLSVVTIPLSVTVWSNANFDQGSDPKSPLRPSRGGTGALYTMLLGTTNILAKRNVIDSVQRL